jgi:hypothetical protein
MDFIEGLPMSKGYNVIMVIVDSRGDHFRFGSVFIKKSN